MRFSTQHAVFFYLSDAFNVSCIVHLIYTYALHKWSQLLQSIHNAGCEGKTLYLCTSTVHHADTAVVHRLCGRPSAARCSLRRWNGRSLRRWTTPRWWAPVMHHSAASERVSSSRSSCARRWRMIVPVLTSCNRHGAVIFSICLPKGSSWGNLD